MEDAEEGEVQYEEQNTSDCYKHKEEIISAAEDEDLEVCTNNQRGKGHHSCTEESNCLSTCINSSCTQCSKPNMVI